MLATYRDRIEAQPTRVAGLTTRVSPNDSPGLTLSRHFCQERWFREPLNRPESFELHAHKAYDLSGLPVNSWFRAKSGMMIATNKKVPIILAEQDLNTLADATKLLDAQTVDTFFRSVPEELERIMTLYFPGSQ